MREVPPLAQMGRGLHCWARGEVWTSFLCHFERDKKILSWWVNPTKNMLIPELLFFLMKCKSPLFGHLFLTLPPAEARRLVGVLCVQLISHLPKGKW